MSDSARDPGQSEANGSGDVGPGSLAEHAPGQPEPHEPPPGSHEPEPREHRASRMSEEIPAQRVAIAPSAVVEPAFPRPQIILARPPSGDDDPWPGLSAIGPVQSERKARDWALVLQSMSVWHVIRRSYAGWVLLVRDEDYASAAQSIDHYEAENRDWPPRPTRERTRHPSSLAVPVMFALLALFFVVTGPAAGGSFWFDRGVAVSERVLGAQPWRAITALTLHADAVHVFGNAISGTVFVSAVQRRIGAGGAALAVLASGVAGNFANAYYHHARGLEHRSLGASTAVFGAIGLLAATQLVLGGSRTSKPRTWLDVAAPIVGGFALLGALGAGGEHPERTDLGAHLFGFLSGLVIGLAVAFPMRRATLAVDIGTGHQGHEVTLGSGAPRWWVQTTLAAIATAIVMVAWQMALRFGR